MSAQAQAISPLVESYPDSTPDTLIDHVIMALTTAGLIAAFVMLVVFLRELESQLKPGELYTGDVVKPPIFYVAHAIQIVLLFTAGSLAFLSTDFRQIDRGYLLRLGLFIIATLLMTARGYTSSDLLSTKLVDATGPFPCLMSLLVFVGARRRYWRVIEKAMVFQAVFFSGMALVAITNLPSFSRDRVIASLGGVLIALYWPAAWLVLRDFPQSPLARRLRFVPIIIFTIGSFLTQSRLPLLMVLALLVVYSFIRHKRMQPQAGFWIVAGGLAVWIVLLAAAFLTETSAFHNFQSIADSFSNRLEEDTRTGQIKRFFESVQPQELVLGRGAMATWNWGRTVGWRGGTDVGYLTMLLYGGVPLLLTYIAAHIKPCFRILRTNPSDWQLTAAGVVFLWMVRMLSSSYLGLTIDYYGILFCVGACISRERSRYSEEFDSEANVSHMELTSARSLVYK